VGGAGASSRLGWPWGTSSILVVVAVHARVRVRVHGALRKVPFPGMQLDRVCELPRRERLPCLTRSRTHRLNSREAIAV
jgi:hypothetical protein